MKMIKRLGLFILATSVLVLFGYGLFELITELFKDAEIPSIIKFGISGIIIGLVLVIVALILERIKDKKNEKF